MFTFVVVTSCLSLVPVFGIPVLPKEYEESTEVPETVYKDLYIIRKVVYEIGILTNAPENETDFNETLNERVDLSFFNPAANESFIDLSNILFPVETNISGTAVTGILPLNLGVLDLRKNLTSFPIFPDKQVKITKNISTTNQERNLKILSGISDVLGLSDLTEPQKNEETI